MVKPSNKSFGLLGGSFDPAHKGHLAISKIAIKKLKLDKILWIVTKQNPFKKKPFYSLDQRIKKAKKLIKGSKKINIINLDKTINSSRSIDVISIWCVKNSKISILFLDLIFNKIS